MAALNLNRLKEALTKALSPWFLGREQEALVEAIRQGGEETLLAVDVDTDALQAQFTNLYSNAGATAIGIADAGGYFSGINVEAALQQVGASIIGGVFQAADADLTAISAVTGTNTYIKRTGVNVWTELTPVQVKTDLSLVKGDVGLGNVDNTSDANKPVSTATQTALNLKANDNAVVHLAGTETITGGKTFSSAVQVNSTLSATNTLSSTGTNAGLFFENRVGTARNYGWYATANSVRLNVSGIGDVFSLSEGGALNTTGAITQNGSQVWYAGNFNPALKANLASPTFTGIVTTSTLNVTEDLTVYRSAAPATGVVFFGTSGARYLFYDGTNYIMPSADLYVNSWRAWTEGTFNPATKLNLTGGNMTGPLATVGLTIGPGGTYSPGSIYTDGNYGMIFRGAQIGAVAAFEFHNSANVELLKINEAGIISGPGVSDVASVNTLVRRNAGGYVYASYFNTTANDIGSSSPSHMAVQTASDGFIRWMTPSNFFTLYNVAGLTNTQLVGTTNVVTLSVSSSAGGYINGNGAGIEVTGAMYHRGQNYLLWANAADWVRIPRTFVGGTDPGAAAADGDLWIV